MHIENLKPVLPILDSFAEYENFKLEVETLKAAAKAVAKCHQLADEPLVLFTEGTNIVFAYGDKRVIKIFPPLHNEQFKSELLALHHLHNKLSIKVPTVEYSGEITDWPYIVMSRLDGALLETIWEKMAHANKRIIIQELGSLIREVHALPTAGLENIDCHWQQFIDKQIEQCAAHHRTMKLAAPLVQEIPFYLQAAKKLLPTLKNPVLLTGEYTPVNILVKQVSGIWHIDGLIDFGDSMLGLAEYDLLGPGAFLIQGDKQLLREFLLAYGYSPAMLTADLSRQFTALMLLHRYSNLQVQVRIKNWTKKVNSLKDLENLVWGL